MCPIDDEEAVEVENDPVVHIPFPTTASQAFITNLASLVDDCHALTATYHTLANITPPQSSILKLKSDLNMDTAAVTSSIAAGTKLVQREVQCMLADAFHEVRGRGNMAAEDEARGRQLMMRVKKDDSVDAGGIGFGQTAVAIEKIAKKMEDVGRKEKRER